MVQRNVSRQGGVATFGAYVLKQRIIPPLGQSHF